MADTRSVEGAPPLRGTPEPADAVVVGRSRAADGWWANRVTSVARAVGGRLFVEHDRLVFEPHGFDRALGASRWSAALSDISSVDILPRRPLSHLFGAGLRRQLSVRANSEEEHFVVNQVDEVASHMRELVGASA